MRPVPRVDAIALESRAAILATRAIGAECERAGIALAIACMDLTTLEGTDTPGKVRALCARGVAPGPGAPHVAAICVYPSLVATAAGALAGSGVRVASGVWIATLDGDGQNDPADIPRLFTQAQVEEDADNGVWPVLFAGHRTARRDTRVKRISSLVANRVRATLLGDATPDTGCGLKLFRRAAFMELPHFDHMHRFLPALFMRAGGRVRSVPVNHRPRLRGQSKYGTLDRLAVGLVDLAGVAWLQRRWRRPKVETP